MTETVRGPAGPTARAKAWVAVLPSPVGELRLVATDDGVADIVFPDSRGAAISPIPSGVSAVIDDHPMLALVAAQLGEYFAGRRHAFSVKLDPHGTAFQQRVWGALATIPYGETRTYAQIARAIGKPTAMRAVGAANGRNPLPIIVPCHRVIGADGTLTGFGGGLETKQWLLDHERRHRIAG